MVMGGAVPRPPAVQVSAPVAKGLDDLISFDSVGTQPVIIKNSGVDGFTDFVDADPMKSTDNDFSDFQESKAVTSQQAHGSGGTLFTQSGINM